MKIISHVRTALSNSRLPVNSFFRVLLFTCLVPFQSLHATEYSANFNNADVRKFVDSVASALEKRIVVAPSVKGKISVRSNENLSREQFYQLFLAVMEVHGYAVLEQDTNLLKVIPSKASKTAAMPLVRDGSNTDSRLVTWVLPTNNIPVRDLAPILRQLNSAYGNVVHFNPSNILIITGRAGNVERLVEIVRQIDQTGAKSVEIVPLKYTSPVEMSQILSAIYVGKTDNITVIAPHIQTKQLVLSGNAEKIARIKKLALQLDSERAIDEGENRVFYLRYARAIELKPILEGTVSAYTARRNKKNSASIEAHEQNNALVVSAEPDAMRTVEALIKELDIRRAQVMVEAIIAEVGEGDGVNLSVQLASSEGSIMQFQDGSTVPIGEIINGIADARGEKGTTIIKENGDIVENPDSAGDFDTLAAALAKMSGAAFTVTSGNWSALLQAVVSSSKSNILSTPSLTTLDNQPAFFVVGDEVPTLTGSTPGSNNTNPYQTIERHQVGIKLQVRPQINEGDAVRLDIEQEVSQINGQTPIDVTFAQRQVKTSVLVNSGDTVVIGGLMDDDMQESVSKVPILGDIPVLGHLFRSTSSKKAKRNLMIFIRPTILRDDKVLREVSAKKYSYLRAKQLLLAEEGISLMPGENIPVLPQQTQAEEFLDKVKAEVEHSNTKGVSVKESGAEKTVSAYGRDT